MKKLGFPIPDISIDENLKFKLPIQNDYKDLTFDYLKNEPKKSNDIFIKANNQRFLNDENIVNNSKKNFGDSNVKNNSFFISSKNYGFQEKNKMTTTSIKINLFNNSNFNYFSKERLIIYCHELLGIKSQRGYGELYLKPSLEGYLIKHPQYNLMCFIPAEKFDDLIKNKLIAEEKNKFLFNV